MGPGFLPGWPPSLVALPPFGGFWCPGHPGGITLWPSQAKPGFAESACADHSMV